MAANINLSDKTNNKKNKELKKKKNSGYCIISTVKINSKRGKKLILVKVPYVVTPLRM